MCIRDRRQGAVVFHTRGHSVGHSLTVQIEGAAAAGPVLNRGHQDPLVQRRFDSVADIVVPMGAEVEGAAPLGAGQAQAVPAAAGILALAQDGHPVVAIVRHIDPGGQGKACLLYTSTLPRASYHARESSFLTWLYPFSPD